jgi:CPA2 family monovalent cation:H+ antiporter-2
LRVSPLVGYLLAGILVGPFTPGFVADQLLANQLAEIRVSRCRVRSRRSRSPRCSGWLGLDARLGDRRWARLRPRAPVASTVVLIRSLQERRIFETECGRIAVGWLIVDDLAMVVALVLLPALGGALGGAGTGGAPSWGSVVFAKDRPSRIR